VSLSFEEFAATYKTLLETPQPSSGATAGRKPSVGPGSKSTAGKTAATPSAKDVVLRYLREHFESESEFQVGKNRVFLRTLAVKGLEDSKTTATTHCVSKFQALARRHLAQRRFKTMRGMAIVLQAKVRMFLKRRKYKREMAEKVEERLRAHRTVAQRNQVLYDDDLLLLWHLVWWS
jgi:myosin heavy subunit